MDSVLPRKPRLLNCFVQPSEMGWRWCRMPLFFFHIRFSDRAHVDPIGSLFSDIESAEIEAAHVAALLQSERVTRPPFGQVVVDVHDEQNRKVATVISSL